MVNFESGQNVEIIGQGSYDSKGRPLVHLEFQTLGESFWIKFPVYLSTADNFSIFGSNFANRLNIKDEDAREKKSMNGGIYYKHLLVCKLPDERQIVLEAWFPMQSNANLESKICTKELIRNIGFVFDSNTIHIFS